MKVLLIQPPIEDFYHTRIRAYPLALLYLATRIKDVCDVSVVDLQNIGKPKVIPEHPFPELNGYYRDDVHTPLSLFRRYYRFGAGDDEIKKAIQGNRPDIVAISSLFTAYAEEAAEIAKTAKAVNKGIITILGGTHPTVFPELTLNNPDVDYVIRGEGETPFFELISSLQRSGKQGIEGIEGVCFKKEDGRFHISEIHIEKDIDSFPDRRFLRAEDYRINKKSYTFFLTSRGCPFNCAFCGKPPVPYRRRSINSIEAELSDCINLDIRAIDFEDDMLTYDTNFFNRVLDVLTGRGLTLSAMNGIYAETLDKGTLGRMYDAGFRRLNFSLVDISSSVVKMQKRHLPSKFLQLIPYLESSPFLVETHFIIGLPEQQPEDVIETLVFLMGIRLLPGPSIFYLAPGSLLFDKLAGDGTDKRLKFLRSSSMMEINPLFPRDAIYTFMKLTRFINFIKLCLDREPSLKRLSDLPDVLNSGKAQIDKHIFTTLLHEKSLLCYDTKKNAFIEEPQDRDILRAFFRQAHGATVKGYKTMNSLVVDV